MSFLNLEVRSRSHIKVTDMEVSAFSECFLSMSLFGGLRCGCLSPPNLSLIGPLTEIYHRKGISGQTDTNSVPLFGLYLH